MALVQVDLTSPDLDWNFVFVAIWSAIEYNMAIVCGKPSNTFVPPFHYLLIGTQLVCRPFDQFYLWSQIGLPFKITTTITNPTTDISPHSLQKGVKTRQVVGAIESPQKRARVNVVLFLYLMEGLSQGLLRGRPTHLEKTSRCNEKETHVKASTSVVI